MKQLGLYVYLSTHICVYAHLSQTPADFQLFQSYFPKGKFPKGKNLYC